MIDYPETRYLPVFLAVCEEGGFRRAAERLHLSQPAVSYQVQQLERSLGVALFERTGRRALLTAEGKLLHRYCRRALGDLAALAEALRSGTPGAVDTLRVASVSGFGRYVLFPLLAEQLADVRVELRYPTQEGVLRQVASGLCDLGIVYESKVSSLFRCEAVAEEELVLIAAAEDRPRRPATIDDLAALPFVTYDEHEYVFGRFMRACFGTTAAVAGVAHFEELEEVVELVRRSRGVSILPEHCARHRIAAGSVRVVRPLNGRRARNSIYAVTRPGASLPAAAERLLALLATAPARPD